MKAVYLLLICCLSVIGEQPTPSTPPIPSVTNFIQVVEWTNKMEYVTPRALVEMVTCQRGMSNLLSDVRGSMSDFLFNIALLTNHNQAICTFTILVETNWLEYPYTTRTLLAWYGSGPDPNTETHTEIGIISSNYYCTFIMDGERFRKLIKSIPFSEARRTYVLKTVKEYKLKPS